MNIYKLKYHGAVLGGADQRIVDKGKPLVEQAVEFPIVAQTPYQAGWLVRDKLFTLFNTRGFGDVITKKDDITIRHREEVNNSSYHFVFYYSFPAYDTYARQPTRYRYEVWLLNWDQWVKPAKTVNEVRQDIVVADQILNTFRREFVPKELRFTQAQQYSLGLDTDRTILNSIVRLQIPNFVEYDHRRAKWINKGFVEERD